MSNVCLNGTLYRLVEQIEGNDMRVKPKSKSMRNKLNRNISCSKIFLVLKYLVPILFYCSKLYCEEALKSKQQKNSITKLYIYRIKRL